MAYRLSFFCRAGETRGDAALDVLLDHLLETGEPLEGEWLGPFVDSVAAFRLRTKRADGEEPTADLLTLEVRAGVAEIAEVVIAASPEDAQGIWGCDLLVTVTLGGSSPDWPLVNRIWVAVTELWGAVPWDEQSGFAVAREVPSVPWHLSAAAFARILGRHGVKATGVESMDAAWAAFREFLQLPVDGVEPVEEDGDGFILEWGCWSWKGERPAFSLARQLAVVGADRDGGDGGDGRDGGDPEIWRVELCVTFAPDQPWFDLVGVPLQEDPFDFSPIGPARLAALARVRAVVGGDPRLAAMWRARPVGSELTFERLC